MKLLSFGEILWDVYPECKYIGGAPLNFAAHFSRHGGDAYMLSALGDDELGRDTLCVLEDLNVSSDYVLKNAYPTGRCLVTLDEKSAPAYNLLENVAWDHIAADKIHEDFDVLYFGTLALRCEDNRRTLEKVLKTEYREIFCDVNLRAPFYSKESVNFAFENATLVKISEEELEEVLRLIEVNETDFEKISLETERKFPNIKIVIITLGKNGAVAHDGHKMFRVPAVPCKAVSTVGAGDSFSAAFLWKYLSGEPVEECLAHASKIASFVVSQYDAVPEYKEDLL